MVWRLNPMVAVQKSAHCHLARRPDWQLQHLAQGTQVLFSRPTVICLPKVDAGRTDANLLGNFGYRQAAPGSSIAEIASETWLARHDLILNLLPAAAI